MSETGSQVEEVSPRRGLRLPRSRRVRWLLGAASAAVLVGAGVVVGALVSSSGEDQCAELQRVGLTCNVAATVMPPTITLSPTEPVTSTPEDTATEDTAAGAGTEDPVETPEETPADSSGSNPLSILGLSTSSPEVTDVIGTYGCGIQRPVLAPGDGYECRTGGLGFAVDYQLRVSALTFYAGGANGFTRYSGPLPYELSWGDPREPTQARLDAKLGEPMTRYIPSDADSIVPYRDTYSVQDESFAGFYVEYDLNTQTLIDVGVSLDKPVCIGSSC